MKIIYMIVHLMGSLRCPYRDESIISVAPSYEFTQVETNGYGCMCAQSVDIRFTEDLKEVKRAIKARESIMALTYDGPTPDLSMWRFGEYSTAEPRK